MFDISIDSGILLDLYLNDDDGSDNEDFLPFCVRYSKAKRAHYSKNGWRNTSQVILSFEKQSDLTMFLLKLPDEYQ